MKLAIGSTFFRDTGWLSTATAAICAFAIIRDSDLLFIQNRTAQPQDLHSERAFMLDAATVLCDRVDEFRITLERLTAALAPCFRDPDEETEEDD